MADKKKILIVDDEPDVLDWFSTLFEDNGYSTLTARDGFDGFEKAESELPDLITLDITMDKESGVKMYRKLHDSEKTNKIPVIMITGIDPQFKQFIEKRKQVDPPAAYFEKPVDKDELLKKIKELIG
ncbi:MAG: response regulator [Candidatus Zixiibacteriota bacterium]|nr:MAG: response regulator [candidate division Zixibacteria bacterium]HHI03735.1 response regulator [candidate division Zixibacteria bacterium]